MGQNEWMRDLHRFHFERQMRDVESDDQNEKTRKIRERWKEEHRKKGRERQDWDAKHAARGPSIDHDQLFMLYRSPEGTHTRFLRMVVSMLNRIF